MADKAPEYWTDKPKSCGKVRDYVAHFANPLRLRILCRLMRGRSSVGELVEHTGERQPTISQQLRLLLLAGLVDRKREGTHQFYFVSNPLVESTMRHLSSIAEAIGDSGEMD